MPDKPTDTTTTTDPSRRDERRDERGDKPPKIRERRATAEVTREQLFNEGEGIKQAIVQLETAVKSAVGEAKESLQVALDGARSALSAHEGRKTTAADDDVVVVGTANIDQNSSMTPKPEAALVTEEEAAYPRGAAQAPDLVFVPDPAAHTTAQQQANTEAADQATTTNPASSSTSPNATATTSKS